jgi:cystathionine gamma-synthase
MASLLSHAGMESNGSIKNIPMAPPLHTATTYTRPADGIYKEGQFVYSRMDNPTRLQLERAIFDLECIHLSTPDCSSVTSFAFSSGLAAVTSIILAHSTPCTVLLPDDLYHGVSSLLLDVFSRHGVTVQHVDMRHTENVASAVAATDLSHEVIVWMETPSNPKCQVLDIASTCRAMEPLRTSQVITTVVDGTMASPILTRPLELGADISFHSGTKYLAGHSDALLGLLTLSPTSARAVQLFEAMQTAQILGGAVASPWDSWLTLRGLRTLYLRVDRQCQTALALVQFLNDNKDRLMIKDIHYPGLKTHPQYEIAKEQMQGGFGGVFSFEFHDEIVATAFAAALQTIHRATSLGGPETLIEHRASVEPPHRTTSPPGLLRVSVGLEDVNDLIDDFENAAKIAVAVTAGGDL